jgi:hypothetical protein
VLNEDAPYAVALIKDTLKNLQIQIEEDGDSLEVDESNLIKVSKVTDNSNDKVKFIFILDFGGVLIQIWT